MSMDTEREVGLTLELLEGWEKRTAGEDMWQAVHGRLKSGGKRKKSVVVRSRWQIALLVVLLGVNIAFGLVAWRSGSAVSSEEPQTSSTAAGSLDGFEEEYRLAEESYDLTF